MNRQGLIRKHQGKRDRISTSLKTTKGRRYILKDFIKFCNLEKEIQIQEAYEQHEIDKEND